MVEIVTYDPGHLPGLVAFWNRALRHRRHFAPLTGELYRARVTSKPAFDPAGLFLAIDGERVVGMAHGLRPAPRVGNYGVWPAQSGVALLVVLPAYRRRGLGGELLARAEGFAGRGPWRFAWHSCPLYSQIEGPFQPFFGSTERLGVSVYDRGLLRFLGRRGYRLVEPGDVSMMAPLPTPPRAPDVDPSEYGLTPVEAENQGPWQDSGHETGAFQGRGRPYVCRQLGLAHGGRAVGWVTWYPMRKVGLVALYTLWLDNAYHGYGLGAWLLDRSLAQMHREGYEWVELHTTVGAQTAFGMYSRRGFRVVARWANLLKS